MLKVGLTGGIACGKSVVGRRLEELGCRVEQADRAAHALMAPHKKAWKEIVARFGQNILNPDQTINRRKLGMIVFSCKKDRDFLNRLIHPLVLERLETTMRRLERQGVVKIYVSEAALTFESGASDLFDRIIVVHCPQDIQIFRLMERDRINRREALRKIRSQMSTDKKIQLADYVIDASRTVEETIKQTDAVFRKLMRDNERSIRTSVRPRRAES